MDRHNYVTRSDYEDYQREVSEVTRELAERVIYLQVLVDILVQDLMTHCEGVQPTDKDEYLRSLKRRLDSDIGKYESYGERNLVTPNPIHHTLFNPKTHATDLIRILRDAARQG